MAQTRTVAPASGIPRELKTMSSLRDPCACAGETMPGAKCSASVSSVHRKAILLAHSKCDANFDRIMSFISFLPAGELEDRPSDAYLCSVDFLAVLISYCTS